MNVKRIITETLSAIVLDPIFYPSYQVSHDQLLFFSDTNTIRVFVGSLFITLIFFFIRRGWPRSFLLLNNNKQQNWMLTIWLAHIGYMTSEPVLHCMPTSILESDIRIYTKIQNTRFQVVGDSYLLSYWRQTEVKIITKL